MRSVILVFVLAVFLVSAYSGLASTVLGVETNTFEVPVYYEVYNGSVSIPANGSLDIPVSLPRNWTLNDTAAIHVVAVNLSTRLSLSARDANGSEIASATIIPLSTEYHITLPPSTRNINLVNPGDEVASGRLVVLVESQPVRFRLEMPGQVRVAPGTATYVHGRIIQEEGPMGFVWARWNRPLPLNVSVYWGYLENGTPPGKAVPASTERLTGGAGWSENFTILINAGDVAREDKFDVTVSFLYTYDYESIDRAQLVATIALSGQVSDSHVVGGVAVSKSRIAAAVLGIMVVSGIAALLVTRRG